MKNAFLFLLLFCCTLFSCDKQDNFTPVEYQKKFDVNLEVIREGFDGSKCWFQPRIAYIGQKNEYSLIMQPWYM